MIISIEQAVRKLNSNDVVCIPTETVYGLAAKYDSPQAIQKIYATKGRPGNKPLILHLHDTQWLDKVCHSVPRYVDHLIKAFWPGPLTIVLPKTHLVPELATANQQTVGVRMPAHPLCLAIIEQVNAPIFAPSANLYQKLSPTRAGHVVSQFGDKIDVVDGGACGVGIESTILMALKENEYSILRPGHISRCAIEQVISARHVDCPTSIITPGQDHIHYRPSVPMEHFTDEQQLLFLVDYPEHSFKVLTFKPIPWLASQVQVLVPHDKAQYEQMMYHCWFKNTQSKVNKLYVQLPPDDSAWHGVIDKIRKASDPIPH